ncbi:uncharacterized protein LOC131679847 [Topomyia yanbarensis]|uniref:uncharacterized protein LOC131679847 n=1 Tax=Topomyia yanbarensis TaxID=2498891 RepID=UPI00273BB1C4|nr:uncharacterized protein LOC131679847 [Topomyia yanbarensis]
MASKFPRADHLTNEEVDYELIIRGKVEETKNDSEAKYRLLRNLFYEDVRENRDYPSRFTIEQEFDRVSSIIDVLRGKLEKGPDERCISRLKHYALRVARSIAEDPGSEAMRKELIREIRSVLNRFSGKKGSEDSHSGEVVDNQQKSLESGNDDRKDEKHRDDGQEREDRSSDEHSKRSLGAIPKTASEEQLRRENQLNDENRMLRMQVAELRRELAEFRLATQIPDPTRFVNPSNRGLQVPELMSRVEFDREAQPTPYTRVNRPETERRLREEVPQRRYSGIPQTRQDESDRGQAIRRESVERRMETVSDRSYYDTRDGQEQARRLSRMYNMETRIAEREDPADRRWSDRRSFSQWASRGNPTGGLHRRQSAVILQSSEDEEEYDAEQFRPRRRVNRRIADREIQDADRRMEKWHLTFSGNPRHRSLEDFLHKIRRLARMDRIADDILLQRVHTILRGDAYDWYLCYADEFLDWQDFEEKIRYMYGNPNKDQGNRQKIYERKQLRNEPFLTFKTEIERLNKLLSSPLDQERVFEVIWDNMRPHYRSKLACRTVRDLRKLEYYAYRIDANDPALRQCREGPTRNTTGLHNIEAEESTGSYSEAEEVNALGKRFDGDRRAKEQSKLVTRAQQPSTTPAVEQTNGPLCWNCRQTGHIWRNCRHEKQLFCYICGTPGQECGVGNNSIPPTNDVPSSSPFEDPFLKVCEVRVHTESSPHVTVKIFDTEYDALLDSGASVSVTSMTDIAKRYGLTMQRSPLKIVTADKTVHECLGFVQLPMIFKGMTRVIPTLVVPQICRDLILGYNFWKSFGIEPMIEGDHGFERVATVETTPTGYGKVDTIQFTLLPIETLPALKNVDPDATLDIPALELPEPSKTTPETVETEHDLTPVERKELIEAIKQFPCTTENKLGRTSLLQHEIRLTEEAKPRRQPWYRCSPAVQAEMEAEIERYKQMDAIEECSSEWASALVPVRKANGKLRVCLDSRKINAWTKKDSYPMRNMGEIFHRLGKAKYYSVVDLKDAYFQIPLKEESRDYTAFRTPQGLFRFKVCPFGLTNAPFTMCRLMDRVIGFDLEPNVFVYLDDIVIATNSFSEHVRLLKIVAERLAKANLTISLDKSRFCRKQVTYLGYLLTESGVSIDNSRISPILDYARPKNVKDIRRLLGLAGFYQRFIRDYSRIVAPISDLLKKSKKKFVWTEAAEIAFGELKAALVSAPILGNPDFGKPFTIESDASDNAVGAALIQHVDDQPRVIAYFSKKLSSTQRKYASVEKECLGVLLAIEHFRHYVEGSRFKVVTDARSLLWLFTIGVESGNSKLLRWALKIQSYDIELEYRKGKNNILADCLSRSVETIFTLTADVEHQELATKIQTDPASFPDFRVIDGLILKYVKGNGKVEDTRFQWKRYPSKAERKEIVQGIHDQAHLGPEKTLAAVKERYFWPRMSSEVKKQCQACLACQTSKATNQNTTPPMAEQKKIAQYPWQFLAMDYVGPLPDSGKGRSTCLLVVTDLFSKFVLVQPFRQATAETLVQFVENIIFLLFGVPEVILSDNGTQFTSAMFQSLLAKYNVTHWRTPNYHPQVNDTERVNRVITTAIRASIRKNHKEWANNLQQIANAVRNSVHDATRYTPYFVLFGRNMVSDGREYRYLRDSQTTNDGQLKNEEREKMLEEVRENLKAAYSKHSSYYNLRSNANCPTYSVGEKVLKKNMEQSDKGKGFSAKLAPKYVPAVVKRVVGTHCYDLEDLKGKRLGIFNCKFLKKLTHSSSAL